ncbi:unnamed protein product [Rhodiola kirilowii]
MQSSFFFFFFNIITVIISCTNGGAQPNTFSKSLSPDSLILRKEKLSHLHFYFHDTVSGKNPTAILVARPLFGNYTLGGFGGINIIDDPLTIGPESSSKLVGKAQGMYASASQSDIGLMMLMNFAFLEGKFSGSTLSILGKNAVLLEVREMPIVGGSGIFRFARGYAQARTHTIDLKTGDAVVEYNVYVLHY